jgi:hypothetical protein
MLIVSDKDQQEIVFEQDLSLVSATTPYVQLEGFSQDTIGNPTSLPLSFSVEDPTVAKILETEKNLMTAYWKFDEKLYNGASDEINTYNGSLFNLQTTGVSKVWQPGRFQNSIRIGTPSNGSVNFGSVEIDHNFSLSFWLKAEDIMGPESIILSKDNINSMKVFQLIKNDGNSSLSFNLYLDGTNEVNVLTTGNDFLTESEWCHLALTYNEASGSVKLFKDGEISNQTDDMFFTGTAINSRFSSMILGGAPQSFNGFIDDLRVYKKNLSTSDIENI